MNIRLWDAPYNGGWIYFDKRNLKRCAGGWIKSDHKLWWAVFGFSGSIILQTWPWQKRKPFVIANHATFGIDLLKALGLGDVKHVTYLKVEAFPPGQLPIVTIKCHPTDNAFDQITHVYEVHER